MSRVDSSIAVDINHDAIELGIGLFQMEYII